MDSDEEVPLWAKRYPPADITPHEFEEWIVEVLGSAADALDELRITPHDRVTGSDGTFDLDATVRFRLMGLEFLVVVEAKRHSNPIKRELVQALLSKVQSIGAQKGVMFSTSHFQRGAITFAMAHGIALVSVTEGRFTFETKAAGQSRVMSREGSRTVFGVPTFVGYTYGLGATKGSVSSTRISSEQPEYVRDMLAAAIGPVPQT